MRVFHIALAADWAAAQQSGRYTVSTRGRSLAEEGFIHASRGDQWQRIRELVYADVTEPLVLLVIETDRLEVPVVDEAPDPTSDETFPHIYGALDPGAVVDALPLDPAGPGPDAPPATASFSRLFLQEITFRAALALGVMVIAGAAGLAAQLVYGDTVALVVALLALVAAVGGALLLSRRRDRMLDGG
ncbi:DUF952 domain-containing protein [Nocardioides sp.]|uniref:DUF952 domain-containing protein n=1 Tax=Nocardioides sp. TaxID=35761 RepID=UPI0027351BDD|nr:DUF952 domain-containing protein [Nocardioides sp.]MDP3890096.1 DUF952 domain-containing protein [Nocardioides sp.]